jgi:AcrR family transcriptional regulator
VHTKVPKQSDQQPAEQAIKAAAKQVFTQKGYAATRTRDIAEVAGCNIALLNYYFRSKEKLYDIVMLESIQLFIGNILVVLNDEATDLFTKMDLLVARYIDMLLNNPGLPLFVLTELNNNPEALFRKTAEVDELAKSVLARQWKQMLAQRGISIHPIHLVLNVTALVVFPFVGKPVVKGKFHIPEEQFIGLMQERKRLIPAWLRGMITAAEQHQTQHNKP